jgi:hypothetical protein
VIRRRRRVARLLDRLGLLLFGPSAEQWRPVTQEHIDKAIEQWARRNEMERP